MIVYLIGAGPGDPGLITIRGRDLLGKAEAVVYDALANDALLKHVKPGAELIYVGKVAGRHALPQDKINELLVQKAREKGIVARLKGGDPYVFGRGAEEGEYLATHSIPFEVVPGVSSAIAAPAYAGIPLTHRDFVSAVTIITGHEKAGKDSSAHNWSAYVQSGATLVFLMGMKSLDTIIENLTASGISGDMPGAVIYRGTTPMQRAVVAPLKNLANEARIAGLSNPAVIVVGKVVSLAPLLDWYSKKPLLGRSVIVTRAREQASDTVSSLRELGAHVLEFPSIKIVPLPDYTMADEAIDSLSDYGWIIFTSANGVKYFWKRLAAKGKDSRALGTCKVAAIGPATCEAIASKGIKADLVPKSFVAEAVSDAIQAYEGHQLEGSKILIPRASKARMALPDGLAAAGAVVDIVPLYDTVAESESINSIMDSLRQGELDCITFTSSSTVDNLLQALPDVEILKNSRVKLAVIGPVTEATLRKYGLSPDIKAEEYTVPALVEAVKEYFSGEKG